MGFFSFGSGSQLSSLVPIHLQLHILGCQGSPLAILGGQQCMEQQESYVSESLPAHTVCFGLLYILPLLQASLHSQGSQSLCLSRAHFIFRGLFAKSGDSLVMNWEDGLLLCLADVAQVLAKYVQ